MFSTKAPKTRALRCITAAPALTSEAVSTQPIRLACAVPCLTSWNDVIAPKQRDPPTVAQMIRRRLTFRTEIF